MFYPSFSGVDQRSCVRSSDLLIIAMGFQLHLNVEMSMLIYRSWMHLFVMLLMRFHQRNTELHY